jgi:hypothetical protein
MRLWPSPRGAANDDVMAAARCPVMATDSFKARITGNTRPRRISPALHEPAEEAAARIAFVFSEYSPARRLEVLTDAFQQSLTRDGMDPKIVDFIVEIYRALARMEHEQGHG